MSILKPINTAKQARVTSVIVNPSCQQTFADTLDTLYYRRQLSTSEIEKILQAHTEGVSLRGIARLSKRSYNTVVDVVRAASQKAQCVHNEEVKDVETEEVIADKMWSFVKKSKSTVPQKS